ncbi:MAG: low molecular weight phosphatase family protein, partial [Geminicoccales bacterium]
ALDEIGVDLSRHKPKGFDDLQDDYFDLVISLSPEAQHRAVELTRTSSCEIEFWPTMEPSLIEGSRETRLDAYRALRDDLLARLRRRFPPSGAPLV